MPHDSKTPDKLDTDDAGHIFADQFGDSPKLDNLVSQDSDINQRAYRDMERTWATAIKNGSKVEVAGAVNYDGDSHRPSLFDITYTINGEVFQQYFNNRR